MGKREVGTTDDEELVLKILDHPGRAADLGGRNGSVS